MTKRQIIHEISNILPRKLEAQVVVEKIFNLIKERLKNGEKVVISGFGTFRVVEHLPAIRRNPRTKEKIMVGPMKKIRFRPSKTFFK
ncbi:MAG: HU family DNA-binding protein [Elusimicrobiales bacterium]